MKLLLTLASFVLVGSATPVGIVAASGGIAAPPDPNAGTETQEAGMGYVDFRVSCAPEVTDDFDRGVALLHHMMYQEARSAFEGIAERAPECAMAHWGIAMTLFQPLWPARPDREARERGWESVQRARELGAETQREQDFVAAAAAFFEDPEADEWWPRIEGWAEAMAAAYEQRPGDPETATFYALSLLATGQTADRPLHHRARAAEILVDVHDRIPRHPGAIHYLIHADDATGRADEHLDIVAGYSDIAPTVPHALHMPSHLYVRLGDWPRVIDWNRRSADAALEHPVGGRTSLHYIHALDYNLYGYLQQGDDERARAVLEEALSAGPYQEDFVTAFHLAIMPARFAVERRNWEGAAELEPRRPEYVEWNRYEWPLATSWFARGLGAVMTGDTARASDAEARMQELRDRAEEAGEDAFATYIEMDRLILEGRMDWIRGREERAVAHIREAAELERSVQKNPVTPGALLPPHEALGDLLLDLGRPAEALTAYEASLQVWPKRFRSMAGAARAASEAGREDEAREYYAALLEIADEDSARPELVEAEDAV